MFGHEQRGKGRLIASVVVAAVVVVDQDTCRETVRVVAAVEAAAAPFRGPAPQRTGVGMTAVVPRGVLGRRAAFGGTAGGDPQNARTSVPDKQRPLGAARSRVSAAQPRPSPRPRLDPGQGTRRRRRRPST